MSSRRPPQRIVTAHPPGIHPDKTAPFWHGFRAEDVVAGRAELYAKLRTRPKRDRGGQGMARGPKVPQTGTVRALKGR